MLTPFLQSTLLISHSVTVDRLEGPLGHPTNTIIHRFLKMITYSNRQCVLPNCDWPLCEAKMSRLGTRFATRPPGHRITENTSLTRNLYVLYINQTKVRSHDLFLAASPQDVAGTYQLQKMYSPFWRGSAPREIPSTSPAKTGAAVVSRGERPICFLGNAATKARTSKLVSAHRIYCCAGTGIIQVDHLGLWTRPVPGQRTNQEVK